MSKALKLDISFPSPNTCVRSFNRLLCNWGQRKYPYDVNGNLKGQTAPLWANPSRTFFLTFFILNFICSILFIASYVVVQYYSDKHKDEKNCQTAKDHFKTVFIVIGSIILFVILAIHILKGICLRSRMVKIFNYFGNFLGCNGWVPHC